MNCIISEYPVNQNYDNVKKMFSKITNYLLFYNIIIQEILDVNDTKREQLNEHLSKLWYDFGKFSEEVEIFIIKNLENDFSNLEIYYPIFRNIFFDPSGKSLVQLYIPLYSRLFVKIYSFNNLFA